MADAPISAQGVTFSRRPGHKGFPGFQGMVTEGDPSSIPWNAFHLLRNFRFAGGIPVTRPGHTAYGTVGHEVYHLSSFPVINPRVRLWMTIIGCFGAAIGTGARIVHYDSDEEPKYQVFANYFAEGSRQNPLAVFGGDLYIGDKSLLRKPVLVSPPAGQDLSTLVNTPPDTPIFDFTGFTITWLKEFDSKLFIGLSNDTVPGASKISYWDGLSIKDDLTGVRPSFAAEVFRGIKLVVGFDATAGHIRTRALGSAPGTWTTTALGGFSTSVSGNAMCEHRDGVLIAGGLTNFYRYSEPAGVATLAVLRNIATADNTGSGCVAVCSFNGLAFYLWNGVAPTYISSLGQWNAENPGGATEFTDAYVPITTGVPNFKGGFGLAPYRRNIYISGAAQWIVATADNDVPGSLSTVNDGGVPGAGINFPGIQLLVA